MTVNSQTLAKQVLEQRELTISEAVEALQTLSSKTSIRNYRQIARYQEEGKKVLDATTKEYGPKTTENLQELLSTHKFQDAYEYIKTREKDWAQTQYPL